MSAGSNNAGTNTSPTPRYETILRLASGGMATVWIGTVRGALGFRQLVAIKKPHPHLLSDPGFRGELLAEARLASMIRHANVVDVRDVEIDGESISLVMDFIEGASLGELLVASSKQPKGPGSSQRIPARVAVRIVRDACAGLHAAHELVDERDRPVGLVHRDVSPQNVLVGTDGISRVTDFGVAKFARKNMQSTSEGSLKGKLAYMAPEYVRGEEIDRRFDVFATGVVLWEALTGKRCFRGENEAETLRRLLEWVPEPVSIASGLRELEPLDAVVSCALMKDRHERFQNAAAMGAALEGAASASGLMGSHTEVASILKDLVGGSIEERRALVRAKLANEPSVASLMGHPPIEALRRDLPLPPTVANRPAPPPPPPTALVDNATLKDASAPGGAMTTAANPATPKMGGADAGITVTTTAHAAAVPSAVPSTQPMTPPLGAMGAMAGGVVVATTMPSAPPLKANANTLASPVREQQQQQPQHQQQSQPHNTLRSEDNEPAVQLPPMPDPSTPTIDYQAAAAASDLAATFPVMPPPRRSLIPFLIGVIVVVGGVVALIVVARSKTAPTTTTSVTTQGATPSSFASAAAATTSAAPTIVPQAPDPVASTASSSTARAPSTTQQRGVAPRPKPTAAVPQPSATSASTVKKPPDNPYND